MSEYFLIKEEMNGGQNIVRGVSAEGKYWLCTVDLFDLAAEMIKKHSLSTPVRPPLILVANSVKSEPSTIAQKFKSFGFNRNDFSNPSAGYLAEEAWRSFLGLAGVKEGEAADFISHIYGRFQDAKARYHELAGGEEPAEPVDSISETEVLRNRVKTLEEKNSSFEARLKSLEHEHSRLVSAFKHDITMVCQRLDASSSSETSKELKAYANRLYARSKQLEEQGR